MGSLRGKRRQNPYLGLQGDTPAFLYCFLHIARQGPEVLRRSSPPIDQYERLTRMHLGIAYLIPLKPGFVYEPSRRHFEVAFPGGVIGYLRDTL
jgi:hypothetical protein